MAEALTINDLLAGSTEPLAIATRGAIRFLIFNRPDARNAMSREMRKGYAQAMQAADADPAITAVVVTGAHGFFSAGVDLKENPAGSNLPLVRPHPVEVTRAMRKPTVAMIDGPCVTGGMEVALACTMVFCSDRSRFVDTHIKIGGFPGWGLGALLIAAIGAKRAAQMAMSGQFIEARQAYDWGIVNEVTTEAGLVPRVVDLLQTIGGYAQENVIRYVDLNRRIDGVDLETALALELVTNDKRKAGI